MFDTAEWSCGPGSVPLEGQEFLATDQSACLPCSRAPAPPAGPLPRPTRRPSQAGGAGARPPVSTLCLPPLEPGPAADGRLLPCTKLPCVLCWGLGGHPQLQPHRVGAEGGPGAPSHPWLSSEQPWAGSVLEGPHARPWRGPHLPPGRLWVCLSVSAVAGGAPMGLPGQTSPAMSPSPRQPCQLRGDPSPPLLRQAPGH